MIVGHVLWFWSLLIICPLVALISVGFAVWVIAKAPWSGGVRVAVVGAALAVGFAPLLWFIWFLDDLGHALRNLGT